jgi:hypothetical protein
VHPPICTQECGKFGEVLDIVIPRPGEDGVGLIFVEFREAKEATAASVTLSGRTFDGRRVEASFYEESRFAARDFS